MASIIAFEVRRALRRRLSLLIPGVPVVLLVLAAFGWRVAGVTALLLILLSSAIVFLQTYLSDREGNLDAALASAPLHPRFPTARRILLLVGPLVAQLFLYFAGLRLLGLG